MSKITDEMVQTAEAAGSLRVPSATFPFDTRRALAAVYPLIEKQVREECAAAVLAIPQQYEVYMWSDHQGDLREIEPTRETMAAAIRALGEKP